MAQQRETISAAELRSILFLITDDNMTVKELRAKLFDVADQDAQVAIDFSMERELNLVAQAVTTKGR